MTELQFLLELLLKHKLPKGTKQLVADRIGEVEATMLKPTITQAYQAPVSVRAPVQTSVVQHPGMDAAGIMQAPPAITRGIVGGEVATGNGTKGPRKF